MLYYVKRKLQFNCGYFKSIRHQGSQQILLDYNDIGSYRRIFSALDIIALVFVIMFVPETKEMSPEEVVRMFEILPLSKMRRGKEIVMGENKQVKAK
ncbi:hypothetical protein WIW89_03430 [Stygiolobus sp. CP850M]|jgi:hypothetical protein|uniref:hypothetical protein n=1 Tax=Stygiolobus sp. CP850M TaxID=3133134 RepID=UPI00307DAE5A